jgi:hypothetical protein
MLKALVRTEGVLRLVDQPLVVVELLQVCLGFQGPSARRLASTPGLPRTPPQSWPLTFWSSAMVSASSNRTASAEASSSFRRRGPGTIRIDPSENEKCGTGTRGGVGVCAARIVTRTLDRVSVNGVLEGWDRDAWPNATNGRSAADRIGHVPAQLYATLSTGRTET